MTPPRDPDAKSGKKWGRRVEGLGSKMMEGIDQSPEEELRQAEEVLRWSLRKNGPQSAFSIRAMGDVADQLARQDRLDEEILLREHIVTGLRASVGPEQEVTLAAELKLATCLVTVGRLDTAEALIAHVVRGRSLEFGENHPSTLAAIAWSATVARHLGNLDAARVGQEQVLAGFELQGVGQSPQAQLAALNLASTLEELGEANEAVSLVRNVLVLRDTTLGPDDPRSIEVLERLTSLLLATNDFVAALDQAKSLHDRLSRAHGFDAPETCSARELVVTIELRDKS